MLVPFGRGNRPSEAVILALSEGVPDKPLKTVSALLDEEPVVSDREIRLALWMRQRYFCTFYDALHTILPAAVWYRYRETWHLAKDVLPETLPAKEAAVCRLLQDGPMETDALKQALGDDTALLLRRMEKVGTLRRETESRRKVRDRVDPVREAGRTGGAGAGAGVQDRPPPAGDRGVSGSERRDIAARSVLFYRRVPQDRGAAGAARRGSPAGAGSVPNHGKAVCCKAYSHYTE